MLAHTCVLGGAAIAPAVDSRRITRDVDAMFVPHGVVPDEALAVADELGPPRGWLNEQASAHTARDSVHAAKRVFDHPGPWVTIASPEHPLAMKAYAARRGDLDDIKVLADHLGLVSVDEVAELCVRVFPDEPLSDRSRLVISQAFETDEGRTLGR